ncbi:MAG: hypothetical protein WBV71_18955, partial [Roseobacter sp.]
TIEARSLLYLQRAARSYQADEPNTLLAQIALGYKTLTTDSSKAGIVSALLFRHTKTDPVLSFAGVRGFVPRCLQIDFPSFIIVFLLV